MISFMVKSRDCAVFTQSVMVVSSRTQATVGQASIIAPECLHALRPVEHEWIKMTILENLKRIKNVNTQPP